MSRKLVSQIEPLDIPAKYKRTLEAWAAFANNDGTNIYPSKESVGKKKSISRWTVYKNTEALLKVGILVPAQFHTCRIDNCNKGATHFTGVWGHYTAAYNLDLALLQNSHLLLKSLKVTVGKKPKVTVAKQPKVTVAKGDATQALNQTQAVASESDAIDSSALTSREQTNEPTNQDAQASPSPTSSSVSKSEETPHPEGGKQDKPKPEDVEEVLMDEDGTLVSMPSFNCLPEGCRTLAAEILRLWPELTRQTYWHPKQEDIWAAVRLVYSHDGEEVVELMPVIITDMAHVLLNKKRQPIAWRDLKVFEQQYERNAAQAKAWSQARLNKKNGRG